MLRSMTGYGQAQVTVGNRVCTIETRSVNNRFFKLQCRLPDRFAAWESELEQTIKARVRRGSVSVTIRLSGASEMAGISHLNTVALHAYLSQLHQAMPEIPMGQWAAAVLALPGVVTAAETPFEEEDLRPLLRQTLAEALAAMEQMRCDEGAAMQRELEDLATQMGTLADVIEKAAAAAPALYRDRLLERVRSLLGDQEKLLQSSDLLREVALLAERSDIAEEVTRLRSHLAQMVQLLRGDEAAGRKLEFLTQELHRETNTMGAKAADLTVSQMVVELKSRIEQVRELVQNIE